MTSLDKYQMVDGWQEGTKKRHKKHKKRSKRKGPAHSSSDEHEVGPQAHVVNTDVGEMPEGAHFSDDNEADDRPDDDPHRALDIDLDKPLAPNEVLPTRSHYEAKTRRRSKSDDKENLLTNDGSHKKKSRTKKDKKEKIKRSKKEDKKAKKTSKNEENLILDLEEPVEDTTKAENNPVADNHVNGIAEDENKEKPTDDLDFWLSKNDSAAVTSGDGNEIGGEPNKSLLAAASLDTEETKSKKTKVKKEKRSKKEKEKSEKKSRKKVKCEVKNEVETLTRNREEYEETNGTVTQENEDQPRPQPLVRLMAQDSVLRVVYSTAAMDGVMSEVLVSIKFINQSSKSISKIELNLPDSSSLKMVRIDPHSEVVMFPWDLCGGEAQEANVSFTAADDSIPHKIRGSLSYSQEDGINSNLPVRLEFPVTAFLSGKTASRTTFTDLLSSGQLSDRSSFTLPNNQLSFSEVLEEVCCGGSLAVVECVDQTASLYGRSLHGHHVCLLVKYQESGRLTIDGKSTEGTLLSNALDHLKTSLMQK